MSEHEAMDGTRFDNIMVEDAPMGIDLDLLLGDDIFNKEEPILSIDDVDDKEVIEFPHFKVSTRRFMEVLKMSNVICQGSGGDIECKSIGIQVVGDKVVFYLTDFEMFVRKEVQVINTENMLTDFIVVNLPIISRIIAACSSVTTIFKKDNEYFLKVVGGDIHLETLRVTKEQMEGKDFDKAKKYGKLPTRELNEALKALFPLASSAVTTAQRRIFIIGKEFFSVYVFCTAKISTDFEMPEMDLSIKSLKILYILSLGYALPEISVQRYKNRIILTGDGFMFSFLLSEYKPKIEYINGIESIMNNESVNVDTIYLSKFAKISSTLIYSTTRMDFNYNNDGRVEFVMRTKRNDSNIILKGESNPNLKPLEKSVGIQSNMLRSLLGVFSQMPTLKMRITPDGIGISNGNYEGVLYTEKIGTVE